MPELSRFEGLIIKMLFSDKNQYSKPHIYVEYGEQLASVGIDGEVLAGDLPGKKLIVLQAWLILHEEELYKAWNNSVRNIAVDEIEPLR